MINPILAPTTLTPQGPVAPVAAVSVFAGADDDVARATATEYGLVA